VPRTSRRSSRDTETDDYLDSDRESGTSRRGRRRDEDPDEDTGRRSRRSRFSDEPEDEPDDEEDERPRRRRGSREDLDDHPGGLDEFANRRDRRSRSEEDRSERSSRDRGGRSSRSADRGSGRGRGGSDRGRGEGRGRSSAKQGWGGYRQTADSLKGGDFADNLKIIDNTDMLIKILDEEPIASYGEHWLTLKDGKDEKRRSYVCLGDDCPICNKLGDRPSVKVCFNVADMDANPPEVKIWTFGTQVGDVLANFAENPKTSPVNRDDLYWTITRTKKNDRYSTTVRPVKARDLVEDFDTEPLTDEELEELEENLFTEDQIFTVKTKAELNKVIEENKLDEEY
jgi:hypothetical protein